MSLAAEIAALIAYETAIRQTTALTLASLAVLIYDYLITLPLEIKYVWGTPLTIGNVLFFAIRYIPFIDTPMSVAYVFVNASPSSCSKRFIAVTVSYTLVTSLAEVIMTLRTWAIWNKSRSTAFSLSAVYVCLLIPYWVFTGIFLRSLLFTTAPAGLLGCFGNNPVGTYYITTVLLTVYESIIFIMTLVKGFGLYRSRNPVLITTLFKDGLLFSACMLVITGLNMIVFLALPADDIGLLLAPFHVLHAIFSGRVILHLKEAYYKPPEGMRTTEYEMEVSPKPASDRSHRLEKPSEDGSQTVE